MNNKNENLYLEQRNNCYFSLIISAIFIIGIIYKTIYNSSNFLVDIKNSIFLIMPIPFMNVSFLMLLRIYKNILIDNKLFTQINNKILNLIVIISFIFFLSIMIIINKDNMNMNSIYCLILVSINFLFSFYLIKKIFNYGVDLNM